MYFTRFPINLTRRLTPKMLSNPYMMHAAISGSVSPDADGACEDGRLLWRVDRLAEGGAYLYIVSSSVPSLIGLDEQIGWPDLENQWKTVDYDPFLDQIEVGQTYSFRLVANPIYRTSRVVDERGREKRLPHVTALQQTAWLIGKDAYRGMTAEVPDVFRGNGPSRAEMNGFQVVDDSVTGLSMVSVTERVNQTFKRGDKTLSLSKARYDGVLRVVDSEAMRHALVFGIGKAKGFGCGLITLAKIKGA